MYNKGLASLPSAVGFGNFLAPCKRECKSEILTIKCPLVHKPGSPGNYVNPIEAGRDIAIDNKKQCFLLLKELVTPPFWDFFFFICKASTMTKVSHSHWDCGDERRMRRSLGNCRCSLNFTSDKASITFLFQSLRFCGRPEIFACLGFKAINKADRPGQVLLGIYHVSHFLKYFVTIFTQTLRCCLFCHQTLAVLCETLWLLQEPKWAA